MKALVVVLLAFGPAVCRGGIIYLDQSSYSATVGPHELALIPFTLNSEGFVPEVFLYYSGAAVIVTGISGSCSLAICNPFIGVASTAASISAGTDIQSIDSAFAFDLRKVAASGMISADVRISYMDIFGGGQIYTTPTATFSVYVDPPAEAPEPSTFVLLGSVLVLATTGRRLLTGAARR